MPSRNVAIQKSVYDALDRERRPGESFSKLFVRFLHEKGPMEELIGAWGPSEAGHDARFLSRIRGVAPSRRDR